ncbi:MAG TPA: hypothetical protein VLS89_20305 [Candidatus Nanopelagicales bacterium]|nr:hypothetical protein [Candidatus Nanopelagicales bacterium]
MNKLLALPLLLAAALASTGCGTLEADLCDLKCDCEGCSDFEYDECLDKYDDDLRDAEREGCEDLYDDLLACEDDTGDCSGGGEWDTRCSDEKDDFKDCVDNK